MADKFLVKGDPSFPHHYLISVGIRGLKSESCGNLFLKHGPIYFHHDDLAKMGDAFYRVEDKVFRQTESEALKAEGVYDLILSILFMRMAASANDCTVHHFSFQNKVDDDYLLNIIDLANKTKDMREKLKEAMVRL